VRPLVTDIIRFHSKLECNKRSLFPWTWFHSRPCLALLGTVEHCQESSGLPKTGNVLIDGIKDFLSALRVLFKDAFGNETLHVRETDD
jgi:hypothetical protein